MSLKSHVGANKASEPNKAPVRENSWKRKGRRGKFTRKLTLSGEGGRHGAKLLQLRTGKM